MIALNTIHYSPYEYGLNLEALLVFSLGSFVIISILLYYYNKIPKSNFGENDIKIERKVSSLSRLILYLSIIIPSIFLLVDFFNFGNLFTGFDIFMLISLTTLILYFNIKPSLSKLMLKKDNLNNPIYQSKDILLQSNDIDGNFLITENTTSIWVKVVVFVLVTIVVVTPFFELLKIE